VGVLVGMVAGLGAIIVCALAFGVVPKVRTAAVASIVVQQIVQQSSVLDIRSPQRVVPKGWTLPAIQAAGLEKLIGSLWETDRRTDSTQRQDLISSA
jgi:hypothetical protein